MKQSTWILEPETCRFCGKATYLTKDDAEYSANKLNISYYPCPYEEGWHLTSKKGRNDT